MRNIHLHHSNVHYSSDISLLDCIGFYFRWCLCPSFSLWDAGLLLQLSLGSTQVVMPMWQQLWWSQEISDDEFERGFFYASKKSATVKWKWLACDVSSILLMKNSLHHLAVLKLVHNGGSGRSGEATYQLGLECFQKQYLWLKTWISAILSRLASATCWVWLGSSNLKIFGRPKQRQTTAKWGYHFFPPKKWKELFFNKFVFSKNATEKTRKTDFQEGFPQDFARAQSFLNTAVEQRHPGALGLLGPLDVIFQRLSRLFCELKIPGGKTRIKYINWKKKTLGDWNCHKKN